jgi:uncharacterized protein YegL
LIDVSESMVGEPIEQVQDGMATIIQELRTDPYALETVYISIIAFAGKAKKLTPLTELYNFYPPKLPVGGGTSLGAALDFLMRDIDSSVVKTTAESKGDWKPVVFLFTDGNPTDDYERAFERWNKHFRGKVNLVVISIGYNADMKILGRISDHVLLLKNTDAESFRRFFKWVTASIKTSSASIGESKRDDLYLAPIVDDLLTKIDPGKNLPARVDDNFAVILAKCQNTKRKYLIKYALQLGDAVFVPNMNMFSYRLVGTYPVDGSYDELSDHGQATSKVNTALLHGFPTCPCCGNQFGFSTCGCGGVHCTDGKPRQTCPWCGQTAEYQLGGADQDVARTRG